MKIEAELAARVLDALLREDYGGLRRHVTAGPGGPALRLPGRPGPPLSMTAGGFQQELVLSRPAPLRLQEVLEALALLADPADADGLTAFRRECRETLEALRLDDRLRPAALRRLERMRSADERTASGVGAWYEALAAFLDHPVHPTGRCRLGIGLRDQRRYAPQFHPTFDLAWLALPRSALTRAGDLPSWWPTPADVGLPASAAATHELLAVHPLTQPRLPVALAETGLADRAAIAPRRRLAVIPTLSMRTVLVRDHPTVHVKVPLPTSTLGLRNRRSVVPRTLADGALAQRLLEAVLAREPGLRRRTLVADEGTFRHAGHEYLAYTVRRLPGGLRGRVVPVAALLAVAPSDRLVIEELADEHAAGDVRRLLDDYLGLLFDLHVTLLARYGVALEAHQQNTLVVLDGQGLRLLIRDHDGMVVHPGWLRAAFAGSRGWPDPDGFADRRMVTEDEGALIDVFTTIVLHLDAGALAFGLAERGLARLPELLGLVRRRLEGALLSQPPGPRVDLLRARLLEADRLPVKSMVTAGTLAHRDRLGAGDINKYCGTTGPNYLQSIHGATRDTDHR